MSAPIAINVKVSKRNEVCENWEDHLILRVPPEVVNRMEKAVNNDPGAEELGINIHENDRTVQIRLGNQILPAKLLDLPTISEVHKTFDNKTIYKVTDISQIIVCDGAMPVPKKDRKKVTADGEENVEPRNKSEEGTSSEQPKTARQIAKEKIKEHQFPHGITAPMKNAKKRRFRKKKEKKIMAVEEIERELKKLLRSDLEAQSVRWEIVEDDGTSTTYQEDQQEEDDEDEDNVSELELSDEEETI